ncbi:MULTISPECIES: excinuclease ABC subunit UvrA [unclassified Enterococcus]|uniref:ATP-binding cassette domain-containing protein n=1 Tax=unclassified Enterococcus TaxID=2608891 RepID=UPI0015534D54|nr:MULTISPECIES: excinuclease ABC subunit UvrA [unclassified Enterococcus]MBS7576526.1 excinuclease ABC subunit UvrA [Enterococcus sp. MMGLQ5-2]MBS7583987.1 excinuclease ABC subunit UvrA [Enterococcus sp. MMGLQ5-1]NPD11848.1 excinuclease ABC subunit UvrA [Enterococcus sp. MMGLQ5-1]NPD36363.1 excinuclease ABC subunit UvrA [Enterococcus sp. MMGLQ5-2]
MSDFIKIKNATTNNLKHVSVNIPKHKIVAVTGVSGSGKSSLVFDTIASESQRLLNETYSSYIQDLLPKYIKPVVDSISNLPVSLVINQKRIQGNSRSTVGTITDIYSSLRLLYSRIAVPFIGYSMKYSFNNPDGMCRNCKGLGEVKSISIENLIDFDKSLNENAIQFPTFQKNGWRLSRYTESGFFDNDKKISDYSKDALDLLFYSPKIKPSNPSENWHKTAEYIGLIPRIMESFVNVESSKYKKELDKILTTNICPSCHGTRLNDEVLSAKIAGKSIADCCNMAITDLFDFVNCIDNQTVSIIIDELKTKLKSLCTVGLNYLTLNRATSTLSGGESQRIKMTKYLNSSLSDVLYIFDEPSVGLHPQDIKGINRILQEIKTKGNSVLFVDHDPDIIKIADEVINFGEGAGKDGGNLTFQGTFEKLLHSNTVTAKAFLKEHHLNTLRKDFSNYYKLENVSKNNLKNISIRIPEKAITIVTGVAGSGKSTLIRHLFKKQYPQSTILDQSLPHASSRSNLTTYLNIFIEIRKVFSRSNKVDIAFFSVTGKGACPECKGKGTVKLDLAYLGASQQICEKCQGKRFNEQALSYSYRGKNISEIFDLTAQEAMNIFYDNPVIKHTLESIIRANLSYIKLGQTLDSFSGGELQRLKIAQLLSQKSSEIIILDEPSTGLHESDIDHLIALIHELVIAGNTIIILEHNLSIISQADWIIDLGPRGGSLGGKLLFQGYPIDFIKCQKSYTASHLRQFIKI